MRNLEGRLTKLEAGRHGEGVVIIRVVGGLGGEPQHASAGVLEWTREPGETLASFEARATAGAAAAATRVLVLGGLPPES